MSVSEDLFYAAQAAYSYRGYAIATWEEQSDETKAGYAKLGDALAALAPIDDVEAAAAAIIAPISAVIPGGIGLAWDEMKGLSRYNLVLIVEAYQRAVAA
ncbi:hypothetical protein QH494_20920 [Sphingomonas sp. AR_OL41]|uniref:hypothetical protein n=1 Tax=Sphingomonas sp. AR_OL41 TaxID=3042729 RepID=UPI002480D023|nr:hypothetical protein [Sphingomonas sp. AR_OL41]MDH7974661.1 hypothetical protein [Sphingomonas sp. AR_OL41]